MEEEFIEKVRKRQISGNCFNRFKKVDFRRKIWFLKYLEFMVFRYF